jgi:hypothetical protein
MGKPEGKTPLERPRLRWEDNIKMDLKNKMGGYEFDLTGSRYGQMEGCCERCFERWGSINCEKFLG